MVVLSAVNAVIQRRLLVNFRVKPDVLSEMLPAPFEPRVVHGWGMAGLCLIGLANLRPQGIPAGLGWRTENAAHRIAVEWSGETGRRQGVYIPRRDTNSALVRALAGRLFPGVYQRGSFSITEEGRELRLRLTSVDGQTDAYISGRVTDQLAEGSIFASLAEASRFFEVGSLGFSPSADPNCMDGLELRSEWWRVESIQVEAVESSFFTSIRQRHPHSVEFDSALIMRGVPCQWRRAPGPS